MKKVVFLFLLSACTKNPVINTNSVQYATEIVRSDYFIPAFATDQTAAQVPAGGPLLVSYYCKTNSALIFSVWEGNTLLQSVSGIPGSFSNGYYSWVFPISFIIPANWSGKLITITSNQQALVVTKFSIQ